VNPYDDDDRADDARFDDPTAGQGQTPEPLGTAWWITRGRRAAAHNARLGGYAAPRRRS
jgi:hypothetical protein